MATFFSTEKKNPHCPQLQSEGQEHNSGSYLSFEVSGLMWPFTFLNDFWIIQTTLNFTSCYNMVLQIQH